MCAQLKLLAWIQVACANAHSWTTWTSEACLACVCFSQWIKIAYDQMTAWYVDVTAHKFYQCQVKQVLYYKLWWLLLHRTRFALSVRLQIQSTCVVHVQLALIEKQVFRVNKTPGAAAPTWTTCCLHSQVRTRQHIKTMQQHTESMSTHSFTQAWAHIHRYTAH